MQLHVSVRNVLKRATQVALCSGAPSVTPEHLLECNPDQQWTEPVPEREISFAPDSLEILSLAGEQAAYDDMPIVRIGHLELALLIKTARQPIWSEYHPLSQEAFVRLLISAVRQERRSKLLGRLKEALHEAPALEASDIHLTQEESKRLLDYASGAQGIGNLIVLVLLRYAISASPQGKLLRDIGLTESMLAGALDGGKNVVAASVSVARKPQSPTPPDFGSCLGPGYERLSVESRRTLGLAWILRDGEELTGRDLLRALIATSNQTEERNVHSLLGSLRPQAEFAERLVNSGVHEKLVAPTLSAEFYRVFSAANREAGADGKITDYDLLLGLAQNAQELLSQENITPEEIRQRWMEGF
ncbi:MAG: hypothetical protein J0I12_28845 [Candidatus Eremiobacteraeota bacterium]|nr:hypothetical protein [Candidatus Eremiobacteraeota bacterium]